MSEGAEAPSNKTLRFIVAASGLALLLVTLPFYLASGLMAPLWAVVVLLLVWLLLFVWGCRWFRSHPFRVILLPLASAAFWFVALSAGEAFLGWTA